LILIKYNTKNYHYIPNISRN